MLQIVGLPSSIILLGLSVCSMAAQPTVILISVDTLRADHLSSYGYRQIRTPNIDSFAAGGTLFTNIQAQIPLTLPSHTTLFTSTYPFETGVEENAVRVPRGVTTLASVLHAQGYKTAAFIGAAMLDKRYGLDQGFEFYDSPFSFPGEAPENPYSVRVRRDGALVLRSALQWLGENRDKPVFVFIHLYDLHMPYTRGTYDTSLAYVDQVLGRLVRSEWAERALIVLTSDHGESLGEHGEDSHGYFIYQSTLWVPLIFRWPTVSAAHQPRVSEPAGLIDVAPTILEFLHIPAPAAFHGLSIFSGPRVVFSESVYARDAFQWAPLYGLRQGSSQFIDAPHAELYDLVKDTHEQVNLLHKNTAEAQALSIQLKKLRTRYAPQRVAAQRDQSAGSAAVLGSLGYLSGTAQSGNKGPDPKEQLSEYQLFEKALDALYGLQTDRAIASFRKLLLMDPKNLMARFYLGESYFRSQKPVEAAREWRAALAIDPSYTPASEALTRTGVPR